MPSTYTQSLRLELQASGENDTSWGDKTNANLSTVLETAIAGVATIVMGNTDYTLSVAFGAADEARNAVIVATGNMATARNLIVPAVPKTYIVRNITSGGAVLTVKTQSGSGVAIPNGEVGIVFYYGGNIVSAASIVQDGTLVPAKFTTTPASWRFNGAVGLNRDQAVDATIGKYALDGSAGSRVDLYSNGALIGSMQASSTGLRLDAPTLPILFTTNNLTRVSIANNGDVTVTNPLSVAGLTSSTTVACGTALTVGTSATVVGSASVGTTLFAGGTISSGNDVTAVRDIQATRDLYAGNDLTVVADITCATLTASGAAAAASAAITNGITCATLTASSNFTLTSDERLKYDWRVLPSTFIADMAQVKSGIYTRKGTKQRQAGVTAQSLQTVLPEAVHQGDRYMSVEYANAALVTAIELCKKVVALEARIAQLEAQ